jgi:hypothetical protein
MLASLKDFMAQQNWLLPVDEDFLRNARNTLSVEPGS